MAVARASLLTGRRLRARACPRVSERVGHGVDARRLVGARELDGRDDRDPAAATPTDDPESPATGVIDDDEPDPPEPAEPA
jgi:hypothetical protein